ncbi:MAG: cob(I)yrinic acid a,c-diamide adenosyltransferase [Chloroflexota bacterium]
MTGFYTRTGDDGYTGRLGEGRVAKDSQLTEAIGALDEATAALGMARALVAPPPGGQDEGVQPAAGEDAAGLLLQAQRDLYHIMAEVSATPEHAVRFRTIDAARVTWLEEQTDRLTGQVEMPREFIVPGDTPGGAALAVARTTVRRAERRVAHLYHEKELENIELLRYLNRLSSLCFVLELFENQRGGSSVQTLARGPR